MDDENDSVSGGALAGDGDGVIALGEDDFVPQPRPWLTIACALASGMAFVTAQGIVFFGYFVVATAKSDWRHDRSVDFLKWAEQHQTNGTLLAITALAGTIASVPLIIAFGRMLGDGAMDKTLGLKRTRVRDVVGWTLAVFAAALAIDLATSFVGGEVTSSFMHDVYVTAQPKWLLWAALCIGAPLAEEFLFRGLLYGGLVETRLGFWGTSALTSIAWASLHIQYELSVMALIASVGIMLALARRATGSIYPCLVMHAAMNAWATFETAYIG